ncbi:MAG: neutral zinc metallopeptidase [Marinagarivorans sp.]|nr:neutral zinc metallopeptidase [Marinagarivorans sp.]
MRWKDGRRSNNIEDKRGLGSPSYASGGGGILLLLRVIPWLLRYKAGRYLLGFGVLTIIGAKFLGIDILPLLMSTPSSTNTTPKVGREFTAQEQELADFVAVVLADTEQTWQGIFQQLGKTYQEPKLVMFTGSVQSACGNALSAMGPFYCPADQKVYIDLSFYNDLKNRHNAPGDFAQAYVIAHEVGHHVQTLLGISNQVRTAQAKASMVQANALSVKQELQADCFAGLWGHAANSQRQLLDPDDIEEALIAAAAIGDDRLQQQGQGYVVPESFTHGSSAERVKWFKRGFTSGRFADCDTFASQ